jgi:uncharacterized protein (TIGR02646 family)
VIRIQKPKTAPDRLITAGKTKRRSHCSAYSRDPSAYQSGAKTFAFDPSIYAHPSVKQALIDAQHRKCCFCERLMGSDGDVEHFRPKQAYKQTAGTPLHRPGYYWLAYDWQNLYLACAACNQRHKQNLFPLQNPAERAAHHNQPITQEQPLFIDVGRENPEEFIGFRGEISFAIAGNPRGRSTIEALKLNQRSLPEARLQRLKILRTLYELVKIAAKDERDIELQKLAREAKDQLASAVQDEAEFAAAARCALQTEFQFIL